MSDILQYIKYIRVRLHKSQGTDTLQFSYLDVPLVLHALSPWLRSLVYIPHVLTLHILVGFLNASPPQFPVCCYIENKI